jgi:hypothetical protein
MFLIDIPIKGCQGHSNSLSIMHAVSYCACGVKDNACFFKIILHIIDVLHMIFTFRSFSKILLCMRCQ